MDELFWDPVEGGWFSTTGERSLGAAAAEGDLRRRRAGGELGGGAEPARAVAPDRRPGDERSASSARWRSLRPHLGRAVPMMLAALSTYHAGMPQIVVAGEAERRRYPRAASTAASRVVSAHGGRGAGLRGAPRRPGACATVGEAHGRMRGGRATAYVCRDFACQAPVHTPEALADAARGLDHAYGPVRRHLAARRQPRHDRAAAAGSARSARLDRDRRGRRADGHAARDGSGQQSRRAIRIGRWRCVDSAGS